MFYVLYSPCLTTVCLRRIVQLGVCIAKLFVATPTNIRGSQRPSVHSEADTGMPCVPSTTASVVMHDNTVPSPWRYYGEALRNGNGHYLDPSAPHWHPLFLPRPPPQDLLHWRRSSRSHRLLVAPILCTLRKTPLDLLQLLQLAGVNALCTAYGSPVISDVEKST